MSELSNMRIMVVDDTETNIDILVETLAYDYKVSVAMDGESALEDIKVNRPDLILLDVMMPDMDGLEVLSELKHDERTEHIPVFMLTDRGMIGDLDQAFEIGADNYITKPSDLARLGKIVKTKWEKYS